MKLSKISTLALAGSLLSSCVHYSHPAPEMPYRPRQQAAATPQVNPSWQTATPPAGLPQTNPYDAAANYPGVDSYTTPPSYPATTYPAASIPPPATVPQQPAVTTTPSTAITRPTVNLAPITPKPATPITPAPAPVVKPATPVPVTVGPATAAQDPKTITNTGAIPVATPVPGDPTRVYNPLDSSKTIRITDKNGKIYPSGKELKVRGTNFHFYVP